MSIDKALIQSSEPHKKSWNSLTATVHAEYIQFHQKDLFYDHSLKAVSWLCLVYFAAALLGKTELCMYITTKE